MSTTAWVGILGVFIGGVTHTAVSMSAPVIPSIISGVLGIFLSSLIYQSLSLVALRVPGSCLVPARHHLKHRMMVYLCRW